MYVYIYVIYVTLSSEHCQVIDQVALIFYRSKLRNKIKSSYIWLLAISPI